MATIAAIRDGLKNRLATIGSPFQAYDTIPLSVNAPCAVVQFNSIQFDETMGRGSDKLFFNILVFVEWTDPDASQNDLDSYLNLSGSTSIKAAVEGDSSLGGIVSYAVVTAAHDYGVIAVNTIDYLTVVFDVEVVT